MFYHSIIIALLRVAPVIHRISVLLVLQITMTQGQILAQINVQHPIRNVRALKHRV